MAEKLHFYTFWRIYMVKIYCFKYAIMTIRNLTLVNEKADIKVILWQY